MNILKKADEIVNQRSEEKERQYGPFSESMARTAVIFNAMTKHTISTEDAFKFMVAHKLAREANAHKEDNLLDACAYIGGLNNLHEETNSLLWGSLNNNLTEEINKLKKKDLENNSKKS